MCDLLADNKNHLLGHYKYYYKVHSYLHCSADGKVNVSVSGQVADVEEEDIVGQRGNTPVNKSLLVSSSMMQGQ